MAAGLPVIGTHVGGIGDFLFDAERNPDVPSTGWAVDVDAPEQIVHTVHKILSDPEKTRQVVETAKAMVTKSYDWNMVAASMRTLFLTAKRDI